MLPKVPTTVNALSLKPFEVRKDGYIHIFSDWMLRAQLSATGT